MEKTSAQSTITTDQRAPLKSLIVHPKTDLLPVYVHGGSILPIQPLVQDTEQKPDGPLELRVYPGPDCKGTLYQDDGITFEYKEGDYLRVNYTCEAQAGKMILYLGEQSGNFHPWWKTVQVFVFDWPSAQVLAVLNDKAVTGSTYDAADRILRLEIPQGSQAADLTITALK